VRTISKAAETALLRFFELARVLVRLDQVARGIVNALFLIETVLSR